MSRLLLLLRQKAEQICADGQRETLGKDCTSKSVQVAKMKEQAAARGETRFLQTFERKIYTAKVLLTKTKEMVV